MMNEFDNTERFEGVELSGQDKITTKITAKGEIQAEVRIGGILTSGKDVENLIGLHKYAWDRLKVKFPNLVKPKEKKE